MTFQHPQVLALLALPVVLAFWEWIRRGQAVAMPFDHGGQRRGLVLRFLVLAANMLPAALLALAILFLARPMTFTPPETVRKLTNVQFAIDTSPSMNAEYGEQTDTRRTRFDAAMDAMTEFVNYRKGDAFGLTIFSRDFIHWLPLTTDTRSLLLSRPLIQPRDWTLPEDQQRGFPISQWAGTFVGKALLGCVDMLAQRATGDRMIILLTDGRSGDIQPPKDAEILSALVSSGVTVFAVSLIDQEPEPALVDLARQTGGEVFTAITPEALTAVFRRIDEMKKVEVLQKQPRIVDHFDPLFPPAFAALALSVLTLFGLRFTPW